VAERTTFKGGPAKGPASRVMFPRMGHLRLTRSYLRGAPDLSDAGSGPGHSGFVEKYFPTGTPATTIEGARGWGGRSPKRDGGRSVTANRPTGDSPILSDHCSMAAGRTMPSALRAAKGPRPWDRPTSVRPGLPGHGPYAGKFRSDRVTRLFCHGDSTEQKAKRLLTHFAVPELQVSSGARRRPDPGRGKSEPGRRHRQNASPPAAMSFGSISRGRPHNERLCPSP